MILKKWVRIFASNVIAIVGTSYVVTGFKIEQSVESIATAALALSIANFALKPLLKIISFPINVATLGFFGIFINAIILYITVYFVNGLTVAGGIFSLNFPDIGLIIPEIQLTWYWTLLFASISISTINWLLKKVLF